MRDSLIPISGEQSIKKSKLAELYDKYIAQPLIALLKSDKGEKEVVQETNPANETLQFIEDLETNFQLLCKAFNEDIIDDIVFTSYLLKYKEVKLQKSIEIITTAFNNDEITDEQYITAMSKVELIKGGKPAFIGEERNFKDGTYKKTNEGWEKISDTSKEKHWWATYKEFKLNKYPLNIPENEVTIDKTGDLDTHAVMKWKDPKSGKIQYSYTEGFMKNNANVKWDRLSKVDSKKIKSIQTAALKALDHEDEKVREAACVISIIIETGLRVGSKDAFSKTENRGVTTLHPSNITIKGDSINFAFRGKSYKDNVASIKSKKLVEVLSKIKESAANNDFLFSIDRTDVDKIFKEDFGAKGLKIKDMRTYIATDKAREILFKQTDFISSGDQKKDQKVVAKILQGVYEQVSQTLNNTPSMAKNSYIHPTVKKEWFKHIGFVENTAK